ncbi:fumarylacetoacetate hydrolase family protein [Anderseniella sp. Alg231-50]|uniref:fumarylacetoacetate hydrolase family protein n=1 Tax=Anderseniella sp. Alg231-50 TaxID=1922226 RepID=UPI000D54F16A
MDQKHTEAVARKIYQANARRDRFKPLRGDDEPGSLGEAYDIQDALYRIMQTEGNSGPLAGHKIAATSPDIQKLCGVDQPVYGSIFAGTIHRTPHVANRADFIRLGVEFEIALEFGEDVPMSAAPFDAAAISRFVKSAMPAFELIEDRNADYSDLDAKSILTDRCWCGGVVLGEPIYNWQRIDLGNLAGDVTLNGEPLESGNTGNALGHPLNGLAWIANHLAGRGGLLQAGEIVMTGSALKTRFPDRGDSYTYTVDNLGAVALQIK